MRALTTSALFSLSALCAVARGAEPGEDLLAAAKKGDAGAVKTLLALGADPNTKNSYDATALTFAADKGHLEVVQLLLKHKANPNVRDNFYKATPLDWAMMRNHGEVAKALIENGATVTDTTLVSAAASGKLVVVQALLDKLKPKEEWLSKALASTPDKSTAVRELLIKAGAKPASKTEAPEDPELKPLTGTYRTTDAAELKIVIEDGKLGLRSEYGLMAKLNRTEKDKFKSDDGKMALAFNRSSDKVISFGLRLGEKDTIYKRVETKDLTPGAAKVEDKGGLVAAPLNWPSFRGPNASGVADGQYPPLTWDVDKNKNIRWKTPIPGLGHSCPVVWDDHIYVTTAVSREGKSDFRPGLYGDVDSINDTSEHVWQLFCLDRRSGKVLWERIASKGIPKVKRHTKGSHANPTPAVNESFVLVSFGSEGLYCYNHDGKLLWSKNLGTLDSGWFYDAEYQWGFGSSPVLYKDLAILQCDVGKDSFLGAYRLSDGQQVWRKSRDEIPSWGSPTIVETPQRTELVTNASKFARGYDPLTGDELWKLGRHSEITVPTPIFGEGGIFVTSGYRPIQPIYAVRPGQSGDLTPKEGKSTSDGVTWSTTKGGPYMTTPIAYKGYLYICSNDGVVSCYDAKSGKSIYKERLGGRGGYTASPVAAEGRIYFTSEESGVRVIQAGPEFDLLAVNPLGEPCMATPAICDGMIFIRTQHHLLGIGRKD